MKKEHALKQLLAKKQPAHKAEHMKKEAHKEAKHPHHPHHAHLVKAEHHMKKAHEHLAKAKVAKKK